MGLTRGSRQTSNWVLTEAELCHHLGCMVVKKLIFAGEPETTQLEVFAPAGTSRDPPQMKWESTLAEPTLKVRVLAKDRARELGKHSLHPMQVLVTLSLH